MKEIEVKLSYQDKKTVERLLEEYGAKHRESINLKDDYYGIDGKTMESTKEILRIREKTGHKPELTFKGDLEDNNGIWERTELNVNVESSEDLRAILDRLPINYIYTNETIREYWEADGLEIVFMNFIKPKRLEIIEVEGKNQEKIKELLVHFGNKVQPVGMEAFNSFD